MRRSVLACGLTALAGAIYGPRGSLLALVYLVALVIAEIIYEIWSSGRRDRRAQEAYDWLMSMAIERNRQLEAHYREKLSEDLELRKKSGMN